MLTDDFYSSVKNNKVCIKTSILADIFRTIDSINSLNLENSLTIYSKYVLTFIPKDKLTEQELEDCKIIVQQYFNSKFDNIYNRFVVELKKQVMYVRT